MATEFNKKNKKMAQVFKEYILSQDPENNLDMFTITNEDDSDIKEGYMRFIIRSHISVEDIPWSMTTIKPIMIMFFYDEDINQITGDLDQFQITLVLRTQWEDDEDSIGLQYFINSKKDLKIEKIRKAFNEYLNQFKYNNYPVIEEEFEDIITELTKKIKV